MIGNFAARYYGWRRAASTQYTHRSGWAGGGDIAAQANRGEGGQSRRPGAPAYPRTRTGLLSVPAPLGFYDRAILSGFARRSGLVRCRAEAWRSTRLDIDCLGSLHGLCGFLYREMQHALVE